MNELTFIRYLLIRRICSYDIRFVYGKMIAAGDATAAEDKAAAVGGSTGSLIPFIANPA